MYKRIFTKQFNTRLFHTLESLCNWMWTEHRSPVPKLLGHVQMYPSLSLQANSWPCFFIRPSIYNQQTIICDLFGSYTPNNLWAVIQLFRRCHRNRLSSTSGQQYGIIRTTICQYYVPYVNIMYHMSILRCQCSFELYYFKVSLF